MDKTPALKKCRVCGELATRGSFNTREIPRPPGEWREFVNAGEEVLGCGTHPPIVFTTYLDGRVIRTDRAVSEKVPGGATQ